MDDSNRFPRGETDDSLYVNDANSLTADDISEYSQTLLEQGCTPVIEKNRISKSKQQPYSLTNLNDVATMASIFSMEDKTYQISPVCVTCKKMNAKKALKCKANWCKLVDYESRVILMDI